MKKRYSIISKLSDAEFINIVSRFKSIAEILRYLGLKTSGNSYSIVKTRMYEAGIDVNDYIKKSLEFNSKRLKDKIIKNSYSLDEILIINSPYKSSSTLKSKLFNKGILKEECSKCKLGNQWNGEFISLHLDHINGSKTDNRLSNLRILCPNCHSQTITFSGKRFRINNYCKCGKLISKKASSCKKCYKRRDSSMPEKEILEKEVWESPTTHLAKKYNVSDKAVEKWCKKLNIQKPPRGYWAKISHNKNT